MDTHGSGWVGMGMLVGCPLVYFIVGWPAIVGGLTFFAGYAVILAGAKKLGG